MNCSEKMMKNFMIIVNALFVVIGVLLIVVGALSLTIAGEYEHLLEDGFFSLPALLITVGVFVTALYFFGCWGLKKESYCFMITFSVILGVILAMELIGGISAYVLRDRTIKIMDDEFFKNFNVSFNPFSPDTAIRNESRQMWNSNQAHGQCCGYHNFTDYYNLPLYNSTVNATIPYSCCNSTSLNSTCNVNNMDQIYQQGCGHYIENIVVDTISMVAKWGVLVAVFHLIWIMGACYFAQMFRRQSYESV